MPQTTLTASNLRWKNINIRQINRHLTQILPVAFDAVTAAGNFIAQGTSQMQGARLALPDLFTNPPPPNLPGAPVPLGLGDCIEWGVQNGHFVVTAIVHPVGNAQAINAVATPAPVILPAPAAIAAFALPPIPPELSTDHLRRVGFRDVASWQLDGTGSLFFDDLNPVGDDDWRRWSPCLYAFCVDQEPYYVGKTKRLLRERMDDYRRGLGDATNARVNVQIKEKLAQGNAVHILGFYPIHCFEWGGFRINLPAGLEDVLIDHFQPEWNA